MSKFNRDLSRSEQRRPAIQAQGPVRTTGRLGGAKTYEGAPAYERDDKSALFMLAVVNMVGENTFYESARDRDSRFADLCQKVALADPNWMVNFITWLRRTANMRSASGVAAMEMARAWQQHAKNDPSSETASEKRDMVTGTAWRDRDFNARGPVRQAIYRAASRPDEPGEMLGYWLQKYGRTVPKSVKRGLGDAALKLYHENAALKYDTRVNAVRFADVLEMCHPRTDNDAQAALFEYLIDRRHDREMRIGQATYLHTITRNIALRRLADEGGHPEVLLDRDRLRAAGMTWEDALSLTGKYANLDQKDVWEAMIPSMGYMALLRNLHNFDKAEISEQAAQAVCRRLSDREAVANSRQFPYRFLSAYLNVDSNRWSTALDEALQYSVQNIPSLPGSTLVLVDTSDSMNAPLSQRSKISRMMAGALLGVAFAHRNENVSLYGFANGVRPFLHTVPPGSSVLRVCERFVRRGGEDGHGTRIAESIRKTFNGHDRVIVITDMQTFGRDHYWTGNVTDAVPKETPLFVFNTAGYAATPMQTGPNRHELGGLTDAAFKMIPLLEAGTDAGWPWERMAPVE